MDEYERDHITKHLFDLIRLTTCSVSLLAKLESAGVLESYEVQKIDSIPVQMDRSKYLYQLLPTRLNSYAILVEALKQLKQSGAVQILNESLVEKYFKSLPGSVSLFLNSNDHQILVLCSSDCNLSYKKIFDANPMFRKLGNLIHCITNENVYVKTCDNLQEVLESTIFDSKQILISLNERKFSVENFCNNKTIFATDKITWSDLDDKFQATCKNRYIKIFNEKMRFLDVVTTFDDEKSLLLQLDENILINLIHDKCPVLFENTLRIPTKHYVSRKLQSRYCISITNLKTYANENRRITQDVFVFSGLERIELSELVSNVTDTVSSQIDQKSVDAKYLLLQLTSEFSSLCEITSLNIHWLHCTNQPTLTISWVKSRGSLRVVQRLACQSDQDEFDEVSFVSKLSCDPPGLCCLDSFKTPICISDSPGMGKTELLLNIGRDIQVHLPNHLFVYIPLAEYISIVNNILDTHHLSRKITDEVIITGLAKIVCKSKFSLEIFKNYIKTSNVKIHCLLDGYDEVHESHRHIADDALLTLCQHFNFIKVYVTTRPQHTHHVENILGVLCFTILPFTRTDQIQFLTNYWSDNDRGSLGLDLERLTMYTIKCLNTIENMVPKQQRDIAGIPLQCLLIGVVFEKEAKDYASDDNKNLFLSNTAHNIKISSISHLFKCAINSKLENSICRYNLSDFNHTNCLFAHGIQAVKLLFPNIRTPSYESSDDLLKYGLLEQSSHDNLPRFVHRTFAEYLSAWLLISLMQTNDKTIHEFFIELYQTMFQTEFKLLPIFYESFEIRGCIFTWDLQMYFFNQILEECPILNESVASSLSRIKDIPITSVLSACAYHDFSFLIKFFLETKHFPLNAHHSTYIEDLLFLAVRFSRRSTVTLITELFTKFYRKAGIHPCHVTLEGNDTDGALVTLLHVAVSIGKYTVVEHFLRDERYEAFITEMPLHDLIYACINFSSKDDEITINNKKQVLSLLFLLNQSIVDNTYMESIISNAHNTLLYYLTEQLEKQKQYGAALHVLSLCTDMNDKPFTEAINRVTHVVNTCVKYNADQFPMSISTSLFLGSCLSDEIFDEFMQNSNIRFVFSIEPNFAYIYRLPLSKFQKVNRLEKFKLHGLNFNIVNKLGQNLLHHLLPDSSIEYLNFLLSINIDVNKKDLNGDTPLHLFLKAHLSSDSMINILLNHNADKFAVNEKGENVLHIASKAKSYVGIKCLLAAGLKGIVNAHDKNNKTPLFYAFQRNEFRNDDEHNKVVNILFNYGADIDNIDGPNDLQTCVDTGKIKITIYNVHIFDKYTCPPPFATILFSNLIGTWRDFATEKIATTQRTLLRWGADINAVDSDGNTFLHLAALHGNLSLVKYLIGHGLDVNAINNFKQTPMHVASNDFNAQAILELLINKGGNVKAIDLYKTAPIYVKFFTLYHWLGKNVVDFFIPPKLATKIECEEALEEILEELICNRVSWYSYHEIVKLLVEQKNASVNYACKSDQRTLLHKAAKNGWEDSLEFLVNHGAQVNFQNSNGDTALHAAFIGAEVKFDVIYILLNGGADVNLKNSSGFTPVEMWTPKFPDSPCLTPNVLCLVLKNLSQISKHIPTLCETCIEHTRNRSIFTLIDYISGKQIRLNHMKILHSSVGHEYFTLVRYFHFNEYNLDVADDNGNTILHLTKPMSPEKFHYLVDFLCSTRYESIVNKVNREGQFPLNLCVKFVEIMDCTLNIFKSYGANFNAVDGNAKPVIISAIESGRKLPFIRKLMSYGATWKDAYFAEWDSLVYQKVKIGDLGYVKFFIENNVNVNIQDNNGNTMLHTAVSSQVSTKEEIVNLLLENMANVNVTNKLEQKPLDIALELERFKLSKNVMLQLGLKNLEANQNYYL